jgi:magnesium chelatase subunit D
MTMPQLSDATWAAGLLAMCGSTLGGAVIAEYASASFVEAYTKAADPSEGLRAVPSSLAVEALNGSVDLAATLALGKRVEAQGLLAVRPKLLVRRAERLDTACTSLMAQALDREELLLIAVMDFNDPDAALAAKLEARLPFRIEGEAEAYWTPAAIAAAKQSVTTITIEAKWIDELCAAALAIGIASPRNVLQAVAVARAIAALKNQTIVDEGAVTLAARLVLAHRAQHAPAPEQHEEPEQETPEPPADEADQTNTTPQNPADAEVILEAIKSALPQNILLMTGEGTGKRGAGRNVKSSTPRKASAQRGRRIGNKRVSSLSGQRLDIIATLRNAAPWQPLRKRMADINRIIVTRDDFRVARIKQRNEATAIFAVDASGSTAFQRLAEAKGAVETILAECYVRRDRVAMVAFRGKKAELLLPPTRSLERAKRSLASLPGGGGTPLAAGLDEVFALATQVRRAGGSPIVIMLTDGRGNIARDGEANKVRALEESQAAARLFAAEGFDALVIDVSPEPQKAARALAEAMHATYLPMPRASANDIASPVRMALKSATA